MEQGQWAKGREQEEEWALGAVDEAEWVVIARVQVPEEFVYALAVTCLYSIKWAFRAIT